MARTDGQRAVIRFCLVALGFLACLFGWVSLLSFDIADPPSAVVWPPNSPVANWCGAFGAQVALLGFQWLGVGAYAALFLLSAGVMALSRGIGLRDVGLRLVGTALIASVFATLGAMFIRSPQGQLLIGPGGVIGAALTSFLVERLQTVGTLIILAITLVVGVILAADDLIVYLFGGIRWASHYSTPVLRHSGAVVAHAGAAVANAGAAVAGGWSALRPTPGHTAREPAGPSQRAGAADAASNRNGKGRVEKLRTATDPALESAQRVEAALDEIAPPRAGGGAKSGPASGATSAIAGAERNPPSKRGAAPSKPAIAPDPLADIDQDDGDKEETINGEVLDHDLDEPDLEAPPPPDVVSPPAPRVPPRWSGGSTALKSPGLFDAAAASPPKPPAPLFTPPPNETAYVLPPLERLDAAIPMDKSLIETRCREQAYILEQTLNEFRVEVQVVAIDTGPVVTVFELKLAPGIKVSQIASLTNDMARALKAPSVRVVAPLPGKNTIGIEVPNLDKEKVRLRDIIENSTGRAADYAIPLYLGKDASGAPLVSDLTRMPHLLIAGTTGSGKSVCVTSIIMSILLTRTPSEVQLILVDPKVVELAMYKDVPHLMCPIITEMSKAEGILDWAATKMDERYALLAEAGVKDIRSYNRLGVAGLKERLQIESDEELTRIPVTLPYIVIVIDELADMMMTSAKEVEFYLCRLAQKSRAVGIHLIVSTQRPQANVVTGLIKSNLPCRIAFRVASRLDSRIVLDQNGGEILMGQGDMLFLPPGQSKLVRAQGSYISDEELRSVVKHCKEQRQPTYHPELVKLPGSGGNSSGERDELFDQAVDVVLETGRGSVSLLQRRLTVGYGRAARLIEQMYEAGLLGEYKGSQARDVLVTKYEWDAIRSQRDREEAAEADAEREGGAA